MAAKSRFQVIELFDVAEPALPRFIGAQRQGESAWRITWDRRDSLPGRLAAWFRELAAEGREPAERVVLGRGVALTMKTALALARFRIDEINRLATGDANQMADFLMIDPPVRGGRGHSRPVVVVEPNGQQKQYPSVSAMARAEHIARPTASRRVHRGLPGRGGRTAL
jgi:hypothetical protein